MKMVFDVFTLVLFFVVYRLWGMQAATASTLIAYTLQVLILTYQQRCDTLQWILWFLVVLLGGSALLFHQPAVFKWNPTLIYGLFALIFGGSHYVGNACMMEKLLGKTMALSTSQWLSLNKAWVLFFIAMAYSNYYVAFHYSTDTWVHFKVFGLLGLTLGFTLLQGVYLARQVSLKK